MEKVIECGKLDSHLGHKQIYCQYKVIFAPYSTI